jgi:O-antigen ligase
VGAVKPAWIEPGFIGFALFVPLFFVAWRRFARRPAPTNDER